MADFEKRDGETVGLELADLEARLREGLRRLDAPDGFAERVLARAEAAGGVRQERKRDRRAAAVGGWWRSVAAVLLLSLAAAGWMVESERMERMEARATREQFAVAMRVTARVTERTFIDAQRSISRAQAGSARRKQQRGEAR